MLFQLSMILLFIISACNSIEPIPNSESEIEIPFSTGKPTLYVFCDNHNVSCFDFQYITEQLGSKYGYDKISLSYLFVDNDYGFRIFNELNLSNIPSYVFFDTNGEEVIRFEELIDMNTIDSTIASIFNDS